MKIVAAIGERCIAFWRGANTLALAMDADLLAEIPSRVRRLEAEVFGPSPAATAGPSAGSANSRSMEISA
jgi:hypothetical protein